MAEIHHAFGPLCDGTPRILILGTFPSPLSREKGEYYANPRNQFWRIIFAVLGLSYDAPDYDAKKAALAQNGVAVWDVITSCEAENALDSSIKNPVYNTELPVFISRHGISAVFFNGGNAYTFFRRGIGETDKNILPSTSPANARMRFDEKLHLWQSALNTFS